MTQVIVLESQKLGFEKHPGVYTRELYHSLSDKQQQFVSQYAWRGDHNWHTGETELCIRKKQFSSEEWSRILFLFPHARLRRGPIR